MKRLAAHLVGAAAAAAVALAVTAAPAAGHAALLESEPADRATLDESPEHVELHFSEAPDPQISWVLVFDREGGAVDHGEMEVDDEVPEIARVDLPPLDDGVYTISWQALSLVDGHVTSGALSFLVGEGTDADLDDAAAAVDIEERASLSPLGVTGRWMLYWGLALLLGWAVAYLAVFRGQSRLPGWVLVGCWGAAVAGLVLLGVAEANSVEVSVGELLSSSAGTRLVRVAALLALLGVTVLLAVARKGRATVAVLAVVAAGTMLSHAAAGHAGAPSDTRWLQLGSQWLHMAGVGAWIGGLVWLLVGTRGQPEPDRITPVSRFSNVATVALGVVVATGSVRALREFPALADLWSTDYGVSFLIKLSLVVVLIVLGAVNRFRNVPAIARGEAHHRALRRVVRGEIVFAAGVFAVTGILASTPPPDAAVGTDDMAGHDMDGMDDHDMGGIVVEANDFGTSVRVTLEVDPGMIGPNRFSVRVADYDTDETLEPSNVLLDFTIPDRSDVGTARVELEPSDDGLWEGEGTALGQPGRWRATAFITIGAQGYEIPLEFDLGIDASAQDEDTDGTSEDGAGGP